MTGNAHAMALKVTPLDIARRFLGQREVPGAASNPHILAMLKLDVGWASGDEVPWCSAFCNYIAWLLGLERSRSLAARSWLTVGQEVTLHQAVPGFDVVVLQRGVGAQPGKHVIDAPGHVGFLESAQPHVGMVHLLGGNQGDSVSLAPYDARRVLSIRRIGVAA